MSRRIVFAGGSQTRALARIYRGEVAGQTGDDVVFIGTGAIGTDAARSTLLLADALVMETDEDGDSIAAADLPNRAELVRAPNLYADFLWPFAGRAHPKNRGAFALPGGPYPAEHGDRYLDQLVADGVGEAAALRKYLALNVVTEGELDSRLADRMAIQQRLDAAGGYDLAGYINDRFRSEKLFNTRQRITMPLLQRLVDQLFAKLGVRGWQASSLQRVPFPAGAQPVHPGVAKHFGLTWANADTKYPVNEEGFFTFAEFCRRYMRFEWNEALHRGIQTAKTRPADALADLEEGLAKSPLSPLGLRALAAARRAAGQGDSERGDAAGPDEIIDEDSYDPTDGSAAPASVAPAAVAPASVPPASVAPAAVAPEPAPPAVAEAEPIPATAETATDVAAGAEPEVAPEPYTEAADTTPAAVSQAYEPEPAAEPIPEAHAEAPIPEAHAEAPIPEAHAEAPPVEEPAPSSARVARFPTPAKPAPEPTTEDSTLPAGTTGFTDFRAAPPAAVNDEALAKPGEDLIEVLPRLLPQFRDLSSSVDRPFDTMPEVMPPPPLRPILPPELQGEEPKQGLLARLMGRR